MIHILALLARAGHGKTTVATYLRDTYGASIVSLATPLKKIAQATMGFSDAQLWGTQEEKEAPAFVDAESFAALREHGSSLWDNVQLATSARIFLQKLGTEGIRKYLGPKTWLEALLYSITQDYDRRKAERAAAANGALPANDNGRLEDMVYVVDDVRFINEVEFIAALTHRPPSPSARLHGGGAFTSDPRFFGTVIKLVCTDAPASGNDGHASEREVDMIPPELIDATATSSRALGTDHLLAQVEEAIALPQFANLRGALNRSAMARAAARARAEREKLQTEALDRVVSRMRERTSGG